MLVGAFVGAGVGETGEVGAVGAVGAGGGAEGPGVRGAPHRPPGVNKRAQHSVPCFT